MAISLVNNHYPYEKWLAIIGNINPTFSVTKPISPVLQDPGVHHLLQQGRHKNCQYWQLHHLHHGWWTAVFRKGRGERGAKGPSCGGDGSWREPDWKASLLQLHATWTAGAVWNEMDFRKQKMFTSCKCENHVTPGYQTMVHAAAANAAKVSQTWRCVVSFIQCYDLRVWPPTFLDVLPRAREASATMPISEHCFAWQPPEKMARKSLKYGQVPMHFANLCNAVGSGLSFRLFLAFDATQTTPIKSKRVICEKNIFHATWWRGKQHSSAFCQTIMRQHLSYIYPIMQYFAILCNVCQCLPCSPQSCSKPVHVSPVSVPPKTTDFSIKLR